MTVNIEHEATHRAVIRMLKMGSIPCIEDGTTASISDRHSPVSNSQNHLLLRNAKGYEQALTKPVRRRELLEALDRIVAFDESSRHWTAPAAVRTLRQDRRELSILIAEDNAVNQKVLLSLLAKEGHRARAVANGILAVQEWQSGSYDLILMDVQMPVLDGLEATRQIRSAEVNTGRHTPVIALTAHALTGDREMCLAAGMDDYVTKPIERNRLFEVIAAAARTAAAA